VFVRFGGRTIGQISPATQAFQQISVPTDFQDIAFSSALGRLFGVDHEGLLYGMDPDHGTVLPGYPVQMSAYGQSVAKTGALAADEAADPTCDDGDPCTVDCCPDPLLGCRRHLLKAKSFREANADACLAREKTHAGVGGGVRRGPVMLPLAHTLYRETYADVRRPSPEMPHV
jgi:hypothetical protein